MSTVNVAHDLVRHTDILSLNSGHRHRESPDAVLFTLKKSYLVRFWRWSAKRGKLWLCGLMAEVQDGSAKHFVMATASPTSADQRLAGL